MSGRQLASLASQSTNPQHDGEACYVCGQNATFRFTCSNSNCKSSYMVCPTDRWDHLHCILCKAAVGQDDFRTDSDLASIPAGDHGRSSTSMEQSLGHHCSSCRSKLERMNQKIQMLKQTLEMKDTYTKMQEDELKRKDEYIQKLEAMIEELEHQGRPTLHGTVRQLSSQRPPITTSSGASSSASPHPAHEQSIPTGEGVATNVNDNIPASSPTDEEEPCRSDEGRKVEPIEDGLIHKLGQALGQNLGEHNVLIDDAAQQIGWSKKVSRTLTLKCMDDERMNKQFKGIGNDPEAALEAAGNSAINHITRLVEGQAIPESEMFQEEIKLTDVSMSHAIGKRGEMKEKLMHLSGCDCSFGESRVIIRGPEKQKTFALALGQVVAGLSSSGIKCVPKDAKQFSLLMEVPIGTRNYVNGTEYGTLKTFEDTHKVLIVQLAEGSSTTKQCYAIFGSDKTSRLNAMLDVLGAAEHQHKGSFPDMCTPRENQDQGVCMDVMRVSGGTGTLAYLTGAKGETRKQKIEHPSGSRVRFFQHGQDLYAFIVGEFKERQGARLCLQWLLDSERKKGQFTDKPEQRWHELITTVTMSKAQKKSFLPKLKDKELKYRVRMAFWDIKDSGDNDLMTLFIFSVREDDRAHAMEDLTSELSAVGT